MGIKNFFISGIDTLDQIRKAGFETIDRKNLNTLDFLCKSFRESAMGIYLVFFKAEIDGILKKDQIESLSNETSNKIVYLLGGYYLNPSTLLNLKNEIEKEGISVKIINHRYYSKNGIRKISRKLKEKLAEDDGKEKVIFGYSAGGAIAHRIGKSGGYKSVSFGLSEKPSQTMVGTLLSLTRDKKINYIHIPETGVNIIEQFSAMVPNSSIDDGDTLRLDNTYSHMSISNQEVIDAIKKEILSGFKKTI